MNRGCIISPIPLGFGYGSGSESEDDQEAQHGGPSEDDSDDELADSIRRKRDAFERKMRQMEEEERFRERGKELSTWCKT